MKGVLLIFVTLGFVPFALSLRNYPSPSVVDSEGKALQVGTSYYAVSVSTANNFQAAGLCVVDLKNQTLAACPHDVVQSPILNNNNKPNLGFPIMFQSGGLNMTVAEDVKEATSYHIRFPVTAVGLLCIKDVFWGLLADDDNMFRKFVTTNPAATANKFTVLRDGLGYRIAYCVSIPVCYAVGFIQDGSNSRLGIGVGVKPIQFFFTKYDGTALHTHATS